MINTDRDDVDGTRRGRARRGRASGDAPQHPARRRSARSSSAGSSPPRWPARRSGSIRSTSRTSSEAKDKTKALLGSLDASGHLAGRAADRLVRQRRRVQPALQRRLPRRGRPRRARDPRRRPTTSRSCPTCRPDSEVAQAVARFAPGSASTSTSPAPSASGRATCTRPGSITRVGRTPRWRSC